MVIQYDVCVAERSKACLFLFFELRGFESQKEQ